MPTNHGRRPWAIEKTFVTAAVPAIIITRGNLRVDLPMMAHE
jgi:hypothetical protein